MMDRKTAIRLFQHGVAGGIVMLASGATLGFIMLAPSFLPMDNVQAAATDTCREADLAAVGELKPLLDRTDHRATVVASNVLATVATARRYCAHGEGGRAAELYAQAGQVLEQFRAGHANSSSR